MSTLLRIAEQFAATDPGRQRHGNEDNLHVRAPLFVVADGMGGAQAGEVASEMAVRSFDRELPDGSPADALVAVIAAANRDIHERSLAERQRAGRAADEDGHGNGADSHLPARCRENADAEQGRLAHFGRTL